MAFEDMFARFHLPIRATQLVFSIVVLGLTAYIASNYYYYYSYSEVNFMIFTSAWTILALAFLFFAPTRFERYANKWAIFGVELVTMIFWFAGFIALAVISSGPGTCGGNHICGSARAASAFGAFTWLLFAITFAMAAVHVLRSRNHGSTKPAPEMAAHDSA